MGDPYDYKPIYCRICRKENKLIFMQDYKILDTFDIDHLPEELTEEGISLPDFYVWALFENVPDEMKPKIVMLEEFADEASVN